MSHVFFLSFFYRLSQVLFLKKNNDCGWHNDILVRGPQQNMGPLPIKTDLLEYDANSSIKIFESLWGAVSTLIINKSEQKKNPIYYAEKIPHDILPMIVKSIDSRVIYLIRDPRDELSSIMEFNKKRCTNNFG